MVNAEKIVLVLCLIAGFLWIRNRSRSVDLENQMTRAILGIFVLLPTFLFAEKYLFEKLPFGGYSFLLAKAIVILVTFGAIGFGFLRANNDAKKTN